MKSQALVLALISLRSVDSQPGWQCCPEGFEGLRAYDDCNSFYGCFDGIITSAPAPCGFGLLFDESKQRCDFPEAVTNCQVDLCAPSAAPSSAPTTSEPTRSPSAEPTMTPVPTTSPSTAPSHAPSPTPSQSPKPSSRPTLSPTMAPKLCCPDGLNGLRPLRDCTQYYTCVNGDVSGVTQTCGFGLLFDVRIGGCNWADQVTNCDVDICMPTGAPTVTPPTTPPPTTAPTMQPPTMPQPTTAPATMRPTLGDGTTEPTTEPTTEKATTGGNGPQPVSMPQQAPVVVPTMYIPPTRTYFPTRTPVLEPTFQPTLQAGDPTRQPQEFRDIPDIFDPNQVTSASMPKRNGRVVLMTISSLIGLHCLL